MKINLVRSLFVFMILAMTTGCAKKRKTFAPTNGAPAAAPVPPPPAVNWANLGQVDNLHNQTNLCYISNSNYFQGQNYMTVAEPIYGVYYDYCSGYYRYYFQGYYYYFAPTGNCNWGPPIIR